MRGTAIAGATGLTGQQVLNRLLDDGTFDPVVSILRRPMHRNHPRLREKVVDFDSLSTLAPIAIETAFCCFGTTIRKAGSKAAFRTIDHDYAIAFAKWARAGGARHFLYVSSVSASPSSSNFYLRVKGETEAELATLGFDCLDILQPSFLLGARPNPRSGERIGQAIAQGLQFALVGPLAQFRAISASTVANAMVHLAKSPGEPGIRRHTWSSIVELANPS